MDREVIAQVAGNGYSTALNTAFPLTVGYNSEKIAGPEYDLEKAAEYLAKAGYEDTDGNGYVEKDGEELVLNIVLSSSSSTAVYQALQDMWKTVGIHVEIQQLENVKRGTWRGDFDFLAGGWQTVNNADGQSYLKTVGQRAADNYSGYYSEAFEGVMKKLDTAFDRRPVLHVSRKLSRFLRMSVHVFFCMPMKISLL